MFRFVAQSAARITGIKTELAKWESMQPVEEMTMYVVERLGGVCEAGGVLTVESIEFCYQYLRQTQYFLVLVSVNFSSFKGWGGMGGGGWRSQIIC